jgi:hypothetical protein
MEMHYKKSSFCNSGTCVEVAHLSTGDIALRDAKNPTVPPHVFTRDEWTAFVAGVRNGEFDF